MKRPIEEIQAEYHDALKEEFLAHPELHGKIMRPLEYGLFRNYIPMSFSHTLLDLAGGYRRLMENWEVEP